MMRRNDSIFTKKPPALPTYLQEFKRKNDHIPSISSLTLPSGLVLVFQDSQNLIPIYCLKDPRNALYGMYPYARLAVTIQRFLKTSNQRK